MTLPNFLIIGAAKSGTTAVSLALQSHPQVHMPFKEPNFFSGWGTRLTFAGPHRDPALERIDKLCGTREQYEALFSRAADARAVGEASVSSLPADGAARRIKELVPRVKLIAVLRQPVDRAFSHFVMNRRYGIEPEIDFRAAILDEPARVRQNWHPFLGLQRTGRYADQLVPYQSLFSAEQLRIYLYEDWLASPETVWAELMSYLALDAPYEPDFRTRHQEGRLYYGAWTTALAAIRPWLTPRVPLRWRRGIRRRLDPVMAYRPTLDPDLRQELTKTLFREDILRLQDLLRRDLAGWL